MRRASRITGTLFGLSTLTTVGVVLGSRKIDTSCFYVQPKGFFWENQEISWSVAISPDGKTLAADAKEGVVLLSAESPAPLPPRLLSAPGNALAFSHDGQTLITGGFPLEAWDWKNARQLWQEGEKSDLLYALAVSPDDKMVATAGISGWTVWELKTGKALWRNPSGYSLGDAATGVAFSPDSKKLAVASMGGELRIYEWGTRKCLRRQTVAAGERLLCVAWSSDGKWLATDGEGPQGQKESVTLWDAQTGQERFQIPYHTRWTNSLVFLPQLPVLAIATMEGDVQLYDVEQRKLKQTFHHSSTITGLSLTLTGKRIAISSDSGEARYWDVRQERGAPALHKHP